MSDGLAVAELSVRRGARTLLERVSLAVPRGSVTALIGPNGAGKSTLLKAVLGLLPSTGALRWDGDDLRTLPPHERARRLAYVPQRSQLAAPLAVRAVVLAGRYGHVGWAGWYGAEERAAADAALTAVDALHLAERGFSTLSAGEQQRVLMARALASGAPCLLLDEPTAALDVGHALDLLALIRAQAAQGRAMLVVLHQLEEARRIADALVLLQDGRVTAAGAPAAVLTSEALARAFGVRPVPGGALGCERLPEGGRCG